MRALVVGVTVSLLSLVYLTTGSSVSKEVSNDWYSAKKEIFKGVNDVGSGFDSVFDTLTDEYNSLIKSVTNVMNLKDVKKFGKKSVKKFNSFSNNQKKTGKKLIKKITNKLCKLYLM